MESANTVWLTASPDTRYLLLEDPETGDVHMPLFYLKDVLKSNYSRKLASLRNRKVNIPRDGIAGCQPDGLLYWQWAFESNQTIKQIVKQELGEDNPQGHLRLILLPIVYNTLAQKEEYCRLPFFHALHNAIMTSTYKELIMLPEPIIMGKLTHLSSLAPTPIISGDGGGSGGGVRQQQEVPLLTPLFNGPHCISSTVLKYMFLFKNKEELNSMKRKRQFSSPEGIKPLPAAAVERPRKKPSQLGTDTPKEEEVDDDDGGEAAIPAIAEDTADGFQIDAADDTTVTTIDDMRRFINQKVSEINKDLTVIRRSCLDLINAAMPNYSPPPPPPPGRTLQTVATTAIHMQNPNYHNDGPPAPMSRAGAIISPMTGLPLVPPTLEQLEHMRLQLQRGIVGGGTSGGSYYHQHQHQHQQQQQQQHQQIPVVLLPGGGGSTNIALRRAAIGTDAPHHHPHHHPHIQQGANVSDSLLTVASLEGLQSALGNVSSMLPGFLNMFSAMNDGGGGGGFNVVEGVGGAPEAEGGEVARRPTAASNTTLPRTALKDEDDEGE
jgi:hypothetical protein